VNELKASVDSNFSSFVCLFKRRECNRAAHALAELGYECVEGTTTMFFKETGKKD
jgi:hypothetical protein